MSPRISDSAGSEKGLVVIGTVAATVGALVVDCGALVVNC